MYVFLFFIWFYNKQKQELGTKIVCISTMGLSHFTDSATWEFK